MSSLALHELHHGLNAHFSELNGAEIVNDYGDWMVEYAALREMAGVIDLSFRSRICVIGADRARYLHGQVTNDVKKLRVGDSCYSAITTAKGKMESDLNILALADELLLDFEPGLTEKISARLERFIVADDVQIVDAAPYYGLLSVQGPKAEAVVTALDLLGRDALPRVQADRQVGPTVIKISDATLGEIYLVNHPRLALSPLPAKRGEGQGEGSSEKSGLLTPTLSSLGGGEGEKSAGSPLPAGGAHGVTRPTTSGFDLFVPNNSLGAVADKLIAAAKQLGGRAAGWQAFETARIEAGIPRFGADMDETNIPLECGVESHAIVYNKGCYIGQEVINRIHSVGHVNKELRGLRLATDLEALPARGDKLFHAGKEIGYITSAVKSPALNANIALGYVRREVNQIGSELKLRTATGESSVKIVELPFAK